MAKLQNLQPEEINKVIQMAKWINSQRNSLGGFYSTQDTVIALSALSKFATSFYVKKINMKVNYEGENINQTTLIISEKNRLLIQRAKINLIENDLNKVNFNIEGNGTALFQVAIYFPSGDFEIFNFAKRINSVTCAINIRKPILRKKALRFIL